MTVYGTGNWKITYEPCGDGVKLLRAVTCDKNARLPEEILGKPVLALGDHALAVNAKPVPGEEIEITCGRQEDEWSNRGIVSLTLPSTLESIENYAFYGCAAMERLSFYGGIRRPGTALFMNCRAFRHFTLHCSEAEAADPVTMVTGQLSKELSADLYTPESGHLRLVFPEYNEVLSENVPMHQFDLTIEGGGYPYHCVWEHSAFSLPAYDALWEKYILKGHDPDCTLRLAWGRLRTPGGLSPQAAEQYRGYLQGELKPLLALIIAERDGDGLLQAMDTFRPGAEETAYAANLAREAGFTQALALLLDRGHSQKPAGRAKCFDL